VSSAAVVYPARLSSASVATGSPYVDSGRWDMDSNHNTRRRPSSKVKDGVEDASEAVKTRERALVGAY
jgi:hypothetical protein